MVDAARSMPAERRPGSIRIYTHNIYARRADWARRRMLLVEGIAQLRPDVVLFQEEVLTADVDQTADILGPAWHIVHSRRRSEQERSGISIASRWPVRDVEEIDLTAGGPPIDEFAWAALLVTLDSPFGPVRVVNHFPDAAADREAERERQAVIVERRLRQLEAEAEMPTVLGGDLDAEPDAASLRFLLGRQSLQGESAAYLRAWDAVHPGEPCWTLDPANGLVAATMPGWPYRQLDHLLVRCRRDGLASLLVASCERVHVRPRDGVWASDHYGLVADLVVPR
ncbi:endonuclease/exonuclease/phosphatase family protein [Microbacterium sp. JZ31]|uniref:endonuclease/exonuclease/phosphatase family protein n=1 Tax=Microbacterium sp. JZ31 TaxID=1906274 RepID=UPI0019339C9B|nr:endonuclease/exonuclease/phosphatase family protein [Microbacterium sp. JZ31]